jgi:diacylglycerol kinase family enzyme
MDDGCLELVLARQKGFASLVRMAWRSRKGEHLDGKSVRLLRGGNFHVQADQPLFVQIDGDILLHRGKELPLRSFVIGVLPGALRVIAG